MMIVWCFIMWCGEGGPPWGRPWRVQGPGGAEQVVLCTDVHGDAQSLGLLQAPGASEEGWLS